MSEASRQELRARIEAGKARQEERTAIAKKASAARDQLTQIAREHPVLLIAGGLAIGVALSTLIPRSPTRKLSKSALGMIATVAELGLAYGRQAAQAAEDAGQSGRTRAAEVGNAIADGTSRLKKKLSRAAPHMAD